MGKHRVRHDRATKHSTYIQFSSVAQSCLTLCDRMNCSTPGLPVHHQLLEFTQTHVHRVRDAIQLSHSLSSPSPPALNLSQNQDLFKWVSSLHEVAKVLEFQHQHQYFQWTPRTDLPQDDLLQYRRCWFDLWIRKILCKRVWQPTPVFLPGESPWAEEPDGLQPMWLQMSWTWLTRHNTAIFYCICIHTCVCIYHIFFVHSSLMDA